LRERKRKAMSELDPSETCLVRDPEISTLEQAFDQVVLGESLREVVPLAWGAIRNLRLQVLRHKPRKGRCTFEITLETTRGCYSLIGKVYAEDRSDVYHAMEEIGRAGFGPEEEFAIPRPVGYVAPLRLLLYEKVAGARATTSILNPNEADRTLAAERCARWLARFHALGPRSGRIVRLNDQLNCLDECRRSLADLGRPFADKAKRLFEQLSAAGRGLGSIEMCAGHGMYTCGQVLLIEGRTVTVDWDTYRVADPSYDVARMLVGFKRLGLRYFGSMHALDRTAEVFLKTYVATGCSDVTTHLTFQKAAICLERAKRELDKQTSEWRERAEVMLDEGLDVLAQG
jgi:aminoglycoside phosphotransferase (APT) family kinase protein